MKRSDPNERSHPMRWLPRLLVLTALALPPAAHADFAEVRGVLDQFCSKCHGEKAQKGGANFATLTDVASVRRERAVWQSALEQLRGTEMPPEGQPKPTPEARKKAVAWIEQAIADADAAERREPNPGKPLVRRLSRSEYNRTVRDLTGVDRDFAAAVGMPADPTGEAFENLADALNVAPALMEKYFASAELIIEAVLESKKQYRKEKPGPFGTVFTALPGKELSERDAARQVIDRFARRAYRRPLEASERERLHRLYELTSSGAATFEAGFKPVFKAILVSPHFLFRVERSVPEGAGGKPFRVSEHELAVRLSYFLWSSMPDDELFRLAEAGTLSQEATLTEQVRRMLRDPRGRALTEQFARPWLRLEKLENARPSTEFFPTFNGGLKQAMAQEVTQFFDHLRTQNASLRDLLDARYTFANAELAKHYGIADVTGPEFRKVELSDPNRGGLLGMAAILAINAHTSRTSPTLRGKWILDVIFGTPPPPPPPDVGNLDDAQKKGKESKTFRELLAAHASQSACAGCHAKIDPLGFGLERFDAIGRWRDGPEVDATGKLPGGVAFNGPAELKQIILKRAGEFRLNITRRMLSYALGRELGNFDTPAVEEITRQLLAEDDRFESLILGVVRSYPFQHRKLPTPEPTR